ncbi:MAG: UvrD-helicase domain-containing protein [Candidatus Anammoximicrobium sp.]|nr:UvrD-helicase domain-containing protein [Candidatus Anammoximicrobium sp.]
MAELNPAQQHAVKMLSGPLLVLAGAGTGKTRVVTFRIANLIKHGTRPSRILGVTFTNKAADEMQERVGALIGKRLKDRPFISTFHAHCVKILRRHIRRLGYPEKFAICDRGDQESIARSALREIRVPNESLRPGDLIHFISGWKSHSISPPDAVRLAQTDKEHLAAMGYRRYQRTLKATGAVDFDDLLLCTEELFQQHRDVLDEEAGRFDHVLVDEYQDTNGSQYRIVKALASRHRNLCVVGDDDQSIYGWRGAEVEHILRFAEDWPDARVVRLEDNYRSTAEILELANRLIAFNRTRHQKVLRASRRGGPKPLVRQHEDENAEAREVVDEIRRMIQHEHLEPRDFAILFRTNEQPRAFETELRKLKLPYVLLGGMSFYDRKEVRDVVAYLKTLVSPQDETSLLRIINAPPRGIGQKAVESLMQQAVSQGQPVWSVMHSGGGLPEPARSSVHKFVAMVKRFQGRVQHGPLLAAVRDLISEVGYEAELQRLYSDPSEFQSRWDAVQEVINALAAYEAKSKKPTLSGFLDEIVLGDRDMDNDKEKQLQRNAVVLMTLHSAKGLEFPHVYMVGMEEGILPHHRSLGGDETGVEEERRLCYVGVTRARERLTLSFPLTRMKWGKARDTIPSRFLYEMTGQAENAQAIARRQQALREASRSRRPNPATRAASAAKEVRPAPRRRP